MQQFMTSTTGKVGTVTSRERLVEAVDRLQLPVRDYIVGGSGSMVLHGMDRDLGDLDIFTNTRTWFDILERDNANPGNPFGGKFYLIVPPMHTHERFDPPILRKWFEDLEHLKVDMFYAWKVRAGIEPLNLEKVFREHRVMIDDIPTISLDCIYDIKMPLSEPKHAEDRAAIRAFQEQHPELRQSELDQRRSYPHLVPKLPSASDLIPR
jgi:hypothetical protein